MDEAQKTLRFTIDFKNGSAGSVGDEQEDVLLLGEDVINRTMPIILCQEEDVDGRHGATIGQLGEDLLFYMQSRGIDEEEAKRIMIKGVEFYSKKKISIHSGLLCTYWSLHFGRALHDLVH